MSVNPHFERIGGEAQIRRLVERFYELMDTLPEAAPIRAMHPQDLSGSREKLFQFLTGWTGGPPLYVERHGPPRLRQRHLPFPIDADARDQWLLCMRRAMEEVGLDEGLRRELEASFLKVAESMRNR